MFRLIILFLSVVVCVSVNAAINLTELDEDGIQRWQPKVFLGESIYTVETYKERLTLKALSNNSASGLILKKKIDLTATPYMNWSWLIEKKLLLLDELSKDGDDFVARVYVVISGGFMLWQTKSLNYVWSSNQDKDLVWDSAVAGPSVKMMSVQGHESPTGKWHEEKRNVYQDLIYTFGDKGSEEANKKAYRYIHVIAIMTDTDNSGKEAESYYGDIIFSVM